MLRMHRGWLVERGVQLRPPWQNLHLCVMEIPRRQTLIAPYVVHVLVVLLLVLMLRGGGF